MAKFHQAIEKLRSQVAGEYHTCRYDTKVDFKPEVVEIDDEWIIKGYLSVFGIKDSYGTRAIKGCFSKSIRERGPESGAKNKIIHLYFHDIKEPIGQYRVLKEDDYGLYFEAIIDKVPGGRGEQTIIQTRSGTLNQYSYGFDYVWDKMEYNQKLDVIDMYECALFEGSTVAVRPSNPETYTIRSKEDFARIFQEVGGQAEELLELLPLNKRMEFRQLITRYKSLCESKPDVLTKKRPLDLSYKPNSQTLAIGEYKLDLKQL